MTAALHSRPGRFLNRITNRLTNLFGGDRDIDRCYCFTCQTGIEPIG